MPHLLLKQKNSYYANLSSEGQQKFQKRLFSFMQSKDFIGRHNLVITDEIKVLISASAIQLTFGLDNYLLSNLQTINVFPRIFYSKFFNTSFKGLTTLGGVLSISWDDFKEGYVNEHDKMNLGLHELAHALNIELDKDGSYDAHFFPSFERWKEVALIDFEKLKRGELSFFRSYGAANLHEFFAVSIEHFFELPGEFKHQLPDLYERLAIMLNQDPGNTTGDYCLTDFSGYSDQINHILAKSHLEIHAGQSETSLDFIATNQNTVHPEMNADFNIDTNFQKFLRHKGVNIAMTTTMLGLFAGIPILIWFSTAILINVSSIFLLLFACGAFGLLQWKYVKNYLDLEYRHFVMYSFSGFGMCMVNLILFLNYNIRIHERSETYTISWVSKYNSQTEILIEGASTLLNKNVNNFISSHESFVSEEAKKITIVVEKGVFGFDMIGDCRFQ